MVLPIGIYHRLKSQATRETLDRRQEGLFILATLRPMGAVFWIGLIAWMVDPGWMKWSSVSSSLAAMDRSRRDRACVRAAGVDLSEPREEPDGYRCHSATAYARRTRPLSSIRHPLYDSAALLTLAVSLIAANWFLFVTGVAIFCLLMIRTKTEEEKPGGSLWRQLSNVHGKDRAFFA